MSDVFDDRKKALEEDYFRKKEREAIEKMRAKMASQQEATPAVAPVLNCPKCDGTLKELTFEGVVIDQCENCQGVWLDAGELEQLRKKEGGWLGRLWSSG